MQIKFTLIGKRLRFLKKFSLLAILSIFIYLLNLLFLSPRPDFCCNLAFTTFVSHV